jgi:hypothetical protein
MIDRYCNCILFYFYSGVGQKDSGVGRAHLALPFATLLGIWKSGIVLPELQRFYGRAIVIITPVEMPISDINRPLSIIIFVLLSVYKVVLGRIYD